MPRRRLLLLVCVCFASFACWAQDTPSRAESGITGVVLTKGGQPATGARVCTSMRRGNGTHANCMTTTDSEGQFTVEHLKAGTYHVFAINEAEGYSIQNQTPGQEVTIDTNQPWPNVTITIRQDGRDGILIGSVTDKLTERIIRNATVQYTAIDSDGGGGTANLTSSLAETVPVPVPSNCDLLVVVMAKGYRGWVYADPSNSSRPTLRLEPGERKELDVQLEPLHGSSSK
jgi:hypothetical protein